MLETGVSTATINEVQSVTQRENEIAFLHNKVLNLKVRYSKPRLALLMLL